MINFLKSLFSTSSQNVNFPNACTSKEDYEQRKKIKREIALNDFHFWNKLEIPDYSANIEYYNKSICPHCQSSVERRKSNKFKCSNCKNVILQKKSFNGDEIYITENEKDIFEKIRKEIYDREAILEVYQNYEKIILPAPMYPEIGEKCKEHYTDDKTKNLYHFLTVLDTYIAYHSNEPEKLNDYRNMLLSVGKIKDRIGDVNSLRTFMLILYIDLIGNYDELEVLEGRKNKWCNSFIAPYIYDKVMNTNIIKHQYLEERFKLIASAFNKQVQYKLPITPEKAWEKILEYEADSV